jgi:hypothetical protein
MVRLPLRSRLAGTAALLLVACGISAVAPGAAGARPQSKSHGAPFVVVLQRVGDPAWAPSDLHVFAAPIGTAADGYAEFGTTQQTILPPPHYVPYVGLGIGPGMPEAPPYTHDMAKGVRRAGYEQGAVFTPEQFSNGQGVYLVFMVGPARHSHNVGSSPDFASGPIIPNALFPISVTGVTYRDGEVFDPFLAGFAVPAINGPPVDPPIDVDGFSHFPIFTADNADFGPPGTQLPGLYRYQLSMIDSTGSGWSISAYFVIVYN